MTRVVLRCADGKDVAVLRHHVPVAAQDRRPLLLQDLGGVGAQALHPAQLVIELLGPDRVAVGQVKRADHDPLHYRLDIAAMGIIGVARQPDPAQLRRVAFGEHGNAVEAFLSVPHGAVARGFDIRDRQRFVGAFEFLEADHVGLLAREPFEQARKPRADAVEIVGRELHAMPLSGGASAGKRAYPR